MKAKFIEFILGGIMILSSCELLDELDIDTDVRDKITGEWKVDEDSDIFKKKSANRFYTVNITKDPVDSTIIYIDGFYEINGKVEVIMNDLNLDIPDQMVDSYSFEDGYGSVAYDFKTISFYYYVDIGIGERDIVEAVYSRE